MFLGKLRLVLIWNSSKMGYNYVQCTLFSCNSLTYYSVRECNSRVRGIYFFSPQLRNLRSSILSITSGEVERKILRAQLWNLQLLTAIRDAYVPCFPFAANFPFSSVWLFPKALCLKIIFNTGCCNFPWNVDYCVVERNRKLWLSTNLFAFCVPSERK